MYKNLYAGIYFPQTPPQVNALFPEAHDSLPEDKNIYRYSGNYQKKRFKGL
jgi:hypothetical protein